MKFYHYAFEEFPDLRSRIAQGKGKLFILDRMPELLDNLQGGLAKQLDKVGFKDEWSYERSISLFIEPIPLDIASIYKNLHELWKSDTEFVQYEIDISKLPAGIPWRLCESPEKTKLLYESQDWEAAVKDETLISKYIKEIKDKEKAMGYIGYGRESLESKTKGFKRKTKSFMEKAAELALQYPEDGGLKKYAACVPHVMIYPGYKPVEYSSLKRIVLK